MYLHANAKLGLAGRLVLVRAIDNGMTLKQAAACFSVSPGWPGATELGRPSLASRFGTERRSLPAARAEATPGAGPCWSA